jgi:sugar-specific transcriptional regulator TrmB
MPSEDLQAALEAVAAQFDFGEYEAQAYLTVLEHGQLTASEIAEYTDIPQPRVYDTVRDLADLGLVELQETRPMRALAVDPEEAFDDIQTSLDDLVDGLSDRYTTPARDAEAVSLIKSRSTILRYLEDAIRSAEYELILSLDPDLLERFQDDLIEQQENGVTIELLLSPAADAPDPESFDYLEVANTVRKATATATASSSTARNWAFSSRAFSTPSSGRPPRPSPRDRTTARSRAATPPSAGVSPTCEPSTTSSTSPSRGGTSSPATDRSSRAASTRRPSDRAGRRRPSSSRPTRAPSRSGGRWPHSRTSRRGRSASEQTGHRASSSNR